MRDSSIVISMYNSKPATLEVVQKLLMPSLINNLDTNKQLILIDDLSPLRTETRNVINTYRSELERKCGDFQYCENENNLGFSGSYNKGMKLSDGKEVLIANDDVYFPLKSIDSMLAVLTNHPEAGAVGPVTNYAYNFQNTKLFSGINDYSSQELQKIENFALKLRDTMSGKTYKSPKGLIGFCMAFNKETLNDVGYFDERYTYGLYEDTDLNRRILNSGRDIILDAATFVEHGGPSGGSMSINQHTMKVMKALIENSYKYAKKWDDYSAVTTGLIKSILQARGKNTITKDILTEAKKKNITFDLE